MLCRAERGQQGRAEKCRCGPRGCGCGLHRDPAESHAEEKVEQLVSGHSGSLDLVVPRLEVEDLAHCTHAAAEGAPSCVCVYRTPEAPRFAPPSFSCFFFSPQGQNGKKSEGVGCGVERARRAGHKGTGDLSHKSHRIRALGGTRASLGLLFVLPS